MTTEFQHHVAHLQPCRAGRPIRRETRDQGARLIRIFAAGPALNRADALTQHDTVSGTTEAALLGKPE